MNLTELLAGMHDDDAHDAPRPLAEAQIEVLKDIVARYAAPCPFRVGDLVMARDGFGHGIPGQPAIVVEVPAQSLRIFNVDDPQDTGSSSFGGKIDMRIATLDRSGRDYAAYWVESWCFEPYPAA